MSQTEEQSKQKFISLMRNLIQYINENPAHQLTIYSCLNTQQIKRLFESLHDYSKVLRYTALHFICKLLHNSSDIVDTLLMRDNCDTSVKNKKPGPNQIQKFLITGLYNYHLPPNKLVEVVMAMNTKLKYKKNTLFWYMQIQTLNIGYFGIDENVQDIQSIGIDPKTHIIGIFVGDALPPNTGASSNTNTQKQLSKNSSLNMTPSTGLIRKNVPQMANMTPNYKTTNYIQQNSHGNAPKPRYTISKAGQFSYRKN